MLETYQNEIIRKRRTSRIFWAIVFFFAGFLYFFFQGYYPSIDLSLRSLTGTGERVSDPRDMIRSFGIVNISVKPDNATILLSSGSYTNDEKRMTNYGTYTLDIRHAGYLDYTSELSIDKVTPYYIDLLSLLPDVAYTRYPEKITSIANIGNNEWIANIGSGMILLGEDFSGKTIISREVMRHIGEGYYLSGSTLMRYMSPEIGWEEKSWSGGSEFIELCESSVRVTHKQLWCPERETLLSEKGRSFTGIISVGEGYIERGDALLTGENFSKKLPLMRKSREKNYLYIEKDGSWYTASGSMFVPLSGNTKKNLSPLETPYGAIEYSTWLDGTLIIIGESGSGRFLTFYDPTRDQYSKSVPFPDISLEDIRITKREGNLFIKTRSALLFLYHNSRKIDWIIDGNILAVGATSALYEKDGLLWKASWKGEE